MKAKQTNRANPDYTPHLSASCMTHKWLGGCMNSQVQKILMLSLLLTLSVISGQPAPAQERKARSSEMRKEALAILAKYNYGPLYTPPSLEKPTIQMPGWAGGVSWAGAACDPETGMMYIPSITSALTISMVKQENVPYAPFVGTGAPTELMQGLPLWKPPYGRITAIDLNTGDHQWMVPMGNLDHPRVRSLGLPPVGRPTRGHALLTKTLLIIGQEGTTQRAEAGPSAASGFETRDSTLRAYDKKTGKVVGEVALPRKATSAPMTYMMNGKQYIVVATGGSNMPAELIALSLP